MPIGEQVIIAKDLVDEFGPQHPGISIGVKSNDLEDLGRFVDVGVEVVCIDVAHGDSSSCLNMILQIKKRYHSMLVIAGNVATGDGAKRLWEAGADVVKVGVGPGSLCTTRVETGNGVPQLTSIMDVAEMRQKLGRGYIIADGGIKSAGDIVKALCFADMVMVGNLFAGCDETPGNVINIDGRMYKEYVGSSTHKANHIEGVAAMAPYKGSFDNVLIKLIEGLKSGCSYQGAHNLKMLKDNPTFIKMTSAGLKESHPHDIVMR
jgi:IMP dehydrogenase